MRKWVEVGLGIELLLTGVFIAGMRMSELHSQFASIFNAVIAVDKAGNERWYSYKLGIAGVRLFGKS